MKVFKFGGASVNSVERIRNLASILGKFPGQKIMVVISAMGKTTNALEKVVDAFFAGRKEEALELFRQVKMMHLDTAKYLLVTHYLACERKMNDIFTEAEWLLYDQPVREYDYYYDQVVCTGELLSTTIISSFLNETGIPNTWVDVRDIIRTDDHFRDAIIDWQYTESQVKKILLPLFDQQDIVVTQGFIGATDENESTTLGREGSDYSAAVFANLLDASEQVIWKDVESVMNADPKQFLDAKSIPELNYGELIEMAYYGAQVIHPKTIKPLQNKNIPLIVKCFFDPNLPGTIIHNRPVKKLPPIFVLKTTQVIVSMSTRDYSFIGETHSSKLYELFGKLYMRPNLTQNTAISFLAVFDDRPDRIEKLALEASLLFDVTVIRGLSLLTIRHYTNELIEEKIRGKKVVLRQQTLDTIQVLMMD